jgi:uncharacterized protein
MNQQAVVFRCEGESLVGILNIPSDPHARGVLIVVGGPQYRAGSHRQFTLLARQLEEAGIASFRFDYRGMGDSTGEPRTFESVSEDLKCAIEVLVSRVPAVKEVVIWGLCDAASAALLYAREDHRVTGLVLVNPWVRTEQGAARVYLRHYYGGRLFQAQFWHKVISGQFRFKEAATSLVRFATRALRSEAAAAMMPLPDRMEQALSKFDGRALLVLSGKDLTADEFRDLVNGSEPWRRLLARPRVRQQDLREANHTFSRRAWRDQVTGWTVAFVKQESTG